MPVIIILKRGTHIAVDRDEAPTGDGPVDELGGGGEVAADVAVREVVHMEAEVLDPRLGEFGLTHTDVLLRRVQYVGHALA